MHTIPYILLAYILIYDAIGCTSLGPHYNPFNHTHGGPEGEQRHAGDFGNIIANADGTATLNLTIDTIHLSGPFSILG